MKYIDCDRDEMRAWVHTNMAKSFLAEIASLKGQALRDLLKNPGEGAAREYKTFEKVEQLFANLRNL